jgi:hypothetical protein
MHPGNFLSRTPDAVLMACAVRTTTTNGSAVDVSSYEGVGLVLLTSTAEASTGTMDLTIQDSDDGSTNWNNVTLLDGAFTQVTNSGASQQSRRIDLSATKKFIRAVQTIGGGSPSASSGVALLAMPKVASA